MSQSRKKDHIDLSFTSVPDHKIGMMESYYEPLLSAHPVDANNIQTDFLGHRFGMPLWVSSMTGGTEKAHTINHNLAKACGEFKLGMGLGSCRPLLDSDERFEDFNVKPLMGDAPLFINLGIAQLESLIESDEIAKISALIKRLDADGLVVHVNPLQEWAQEEGDRYKNPAIDTIRTLCDVADYPLIVKEVGQGMGPQSLKALLSLPIAAIELAGYGGTNFSLLEQRRRYGGEVDHSSPDAAFGYVGHTAEQMVEYLNVLTDQKLSDTEIIISGGIRDVVNGHILRKKLNMNSVIGMAGTLLKHAMGDYEDLHIYLQRMQDCFMIADAFIMPNVVTDHG